MIHMSNLHGTPLLSHIGSHALANPSALAFSTASAEQGMTYAQLCADLLFLALKLISALSRSRGLIGGCDLGEKPVAILGEGYAGMMGLLGVWAAGGVVVPLQGLDVGVRMKLFRDAGVEMILCDAASRAVADELAASGKDGKGGRAVVVVQMDPVELGGSSRGNSEADTADNLRRSAEWTRDLKLLSGRRKAAILYIGQEGSEAPLSMALTHDELSARIEESAERSKANVSEGSVPLDLQDGLLTSTLPALWDGRTAAKRGE